MMKKFMLLLVVTVAFYGCDKIDDPLKNTGFNSVGCSCEVNDNEPFITHKNLLIEEFTGIQCVNCPSASSEIKGYETKFPGLIHTIAIHAGNYAVPDPPEFPNDFRTTEGNELYKFANPIGVPAAMLNRLDYGTPDFAKIYLAWESEVNEILQDPEAEFGILAQATLHEDTVCLIAKFKSLADHTGKNLKWAAFLTESDIIAPQKTTTDPIWDYEHRHLLRASFNGSFGTTIPSFNGGIDEVACVSRSLIMDPNWAMGNCQIVVYVYEEQSNSREVLQVTTVHL